MKTCRSDGGDGKDFFGELYTAVRVGEIGIAVCQHELRKQTEKGCVIQNGLFL